LSSVKSEKHNVDSITVLILTNDTFIWTSYDKLKGKFNYFHKLLWISYKNYNFVFIT